MSGKEAVRSLRERGIQQAPVDLNPIVRTIAFTLIAFVVGGGAVYGGVRLLSGSPGPDAPSAVPTVNVAMVSEIPDWTDTDERTCKMAFNSAVQAEKDVQKRAMESGQIMATGGSGSVAPMGAQLRCFASTKSERFCDPEHRALLVASVKQYIEQSMFIGAIAEASDFSMDVYMPAIGAANGIDMTDHPGVGIVKDMTKSVSQRMLDTHKKLASTLRRLVENGYVREEDFGSFMGFGVPIMVKNMLKGVEPGPSACA